MRRLDRLILKSFLAPFILTTAVATFILLIQYMLKYFDDFVGKDLGFSVFAELLFYFSLNMLSISLPLGILVSSLMTFGNLGEHFELTAIKSAGISLLRALRPIFILVIFITYGAFQFNNHVVPAANLQAYSLLYDIKHTKPALDIKPGIFYNGIPDYSIKVKEKLPDNMTLKEVLIYDHTEKQGNKTLIMADSSRMYTFANDRYLKLELFDGNVNHEQNKDASKVDYFHRTNFDQMEIVFDLSSFGLIDTDEQLFRNNRQMKNIAELTEDLDSLTNQRFLVQNDFARATTNVLRYHLTERIEVEDVSHLIPENPDSLESEEQQAGFFTFLDWQQLKKKLSQQVAQEQDTTEARAIDPKQLTISRDQLTAQRPEVPAIEQLDTAKVDVTESQLFREKAIADLTWEDLNAKFEENHQKKSAIDQSLSQARTIKSQIVGIKSRLTLLESNLNKYAVEKYKKYSQAFACIVMFLIGAPLGAIIKKGGLGVPVIVSIFFFILYYVLNITSEKWAKAGLTDPMLSVWTADFLLLPIGLFFLRQARVDARLFDGDFYNVVIDKIKSRLRKRKQTDQSLQSTSPTSTFAVSNSGQKNER